MYHPNNMNIILDNIIFSLQNAGGISVVWYELLKRILKDPDFSPYFIDSHNNNLFRKKLKISTDALIKSPLAKYPISLQRYSNPNKLPGHGIFHSSYFRTTNDPRYINVTTVHDFTYEYYSHGIPKIVHTAQKGHAIKHSKKIICVSENTKLDLIKFYPNINPEQINVIYNGVDDIYRPIKTKNNNQIINLIPYSKNEFVLYVGDRRGLYKNFNVIIKVCREAKIPLVMVGGGKLKRVEKASLTNQIGKNNFIQIGGIDNSLLNVLYNYALCLLYPSAYEGFGIPIIEAQKAGCPVISAQNSSIPEVAGDGAVLIKNINSAKIVDVLKQLKANSRFTDSIIQSGFKNARRFSWEKTYQQTKDVYKELYSQYFNL